MYIFSAEALMYFDYPLEQGLRPGTVTTGASALVYFDYPLEQGLRHYHVAISLCCHNVF